MHALPHHATADAHAAGVAADLEYRIEPVEREEVEAHGECGAFGGGGRDLAADGGMAELAKRDGSSELVHTVPASRRSIGGASIRAASARVAVTAQASASGAGGVPR